PVAQSLELGLQRRGHPAVERVEELLCEVGLAGPGLRIDREELREVVLADVQAFEVEVFGAGQAADRAFHGSGIALDATDDPLEHARVVAEARPEEAAVGALAEPVDLEDARSTVEAQLLAD